MKLVKHIGKLKELETKVIVVFMQLPEDKKQSLVVAINSLPDLVRDELMRLIESDECQKENDLSKFLNRKTLTSSSGGSVLNWLHSSAKLIKVPVESVIMLPHPSHPIALTEVLGLMDSASAPEMSHGSSTTAKTISSEEKVAIAKNLLLEAEMLRADADKKEKQAHDMMPSDCFEAPKKTKPASKKSKKTEA